MLKAVTFGGFESRPAVQARLQELMPAVADELGPAAGRVALKWKFLPEADGVPERVRLSLEDDLMNGKSSCYLFAQDWVDEQRVRRQVRQAHIAILDEFIKFQVELMRRELATAGAP
jgi:hypothetical protein